MEETHNYAMNLIIPIMGIAPLLMLFILKGEKKSKTSKSWTRSTNQNYVQNKMMFFIKDLLDKVIFITLIYFLRQLLA